ncbi:spore coat protein U domain-containing protein, partial [Thermodesulfobacteriota bacterium]
LALFVMAIAFAATAFAGSQAGIMNVTTNVVAEGSFLVSDLAFPVYDINYNQTTWANGQIDVWVTQGSPFAVSLDAGTGMNGYWGPRQMTGLNTGAPLDYEIWDNMSGLLWGSFDYMSQFGGGDLIGVANPHVAELAYGLGGGLAPNPPVSLYPLGDLFPMQPVPPDTYSDVINVLLVY